MEGPRPDGSCSRVFAGCKPTRSVMGKRRLLVTTVFGLAIGGLLLAASTDGWHSFFSPGPLTSHHHTISDCADCHTAAEANMGLWVEKAVDVASRHDQNAGCQKCHADQLGPNPLLAHGLSETRLASLQQIASTRASDGAANSSVAWDALVRQGTPAPDQTHDCATCHTEHRGSDFDIKQLSDRQCQSCHQSTFHSFNDGHPEFSGYPYTKKSHLYFDHVTHLQKHFVESARDGDLDRNWECRDCHQPDLVGRSMVLRSYEETCAACHDRQIRNAGNPGIEFFALPAIDKASLDQNHAIGDWPDVFPVHVQARGSLSPLMILLLSTEQGLPESMERMARLDLSDLSSVSDADRQDVVNFVWLFKQSLGQIISEGRLAFRDRLAIALDTDSVPADVAGQFYDQLVSAQKRWLPRLEEELQSHQDDPVRALDPMESDDESRLVSDRESHLAIDAGWYLQGMDLSVRYRPSQHADAWLRVWIDSVLALPQRPESRISRSLTNSVFQHALPEIGSFVSTGRCLKCHTSVGDAAQGQLVRWQSRDESSLSGKMTWFDHQPHLTGVAGECQACHPLGTASEDRDGLYRKSFVDSAWMPNTDPNQFVSDFADLSIASCAECHADAKVSNRCVTCHPYHVRP